MPSYKNNAPNPILGIAPGQTGELDEDTAAGFIGPGALEVGGSVQPSEDFDEIEWRRVNREELRGTAYGDDAE